MTESGTPGERGQRISETFSELSEEISGLVRDELDRARAELTARAAEAAKGSGYLAAAGAFGLAASGAALSLPVFVLRRMLSAEATAVVMAGAYGGLAFAFGRRALERIQTAAPAAVEEKLEEKKQELSESLKERMPTASG